MKEEKNGAKGNNGDKKEKRMTLGAMSKTDSDEPIPGLRRPSVAIAEEDVENLSEGIFEYPEVDLPVGILEAWEVSLPMFQGDTLGGTSPERLNWIVRDYTPPVEPTGAEIRLAEAVRLIREAMRAEGFTYGRPSDYRVASLKALNVEDHDLDDEDFDAGAALAEEKPRTTQRKEDTSNGN